MEAALQSHLKAVGTPGPQAEANYAKSLARLRLQVPEAVDVLVEKLSQLPPAAYGARWRIVHTLGELGGDQAVRALADMIASPLATVAPSAAGEEMGETHDSPGDNEIVLRFMAIEGLMKQIRGGSPAAALKAMTDILKSAPSFIRKEAAIQYLFATDKAATTVAEIRSLLPADEQSFVLNMKKGVREPTARPDDMSVAPGPHPDETRRKR